MLVVGMEFIWKGDIVSPDTRLVTSDMRRIPTLDHEGRDVSMKDGAVVLAGGGQREEIEGRSGASVAKDFGLEVTVGGMNRHGHGQLFLLLQVVGDSEVSSGGKYQVRCDLQ